MNSIIFELSRFVFFLLLASSAYLVFILLFYSTKRYFNNLRIKYLDKNFSSDLKKYLFSDSKIIPPAWFKVKARSLRRSLEDFLIKQVNLTTENPAAFQRLIRVWETLGFPEENIKRLRSIKESEKVRACLSLGVFRHSPACRSVRELLHVPSEKTRWAATFSLFNMRDEKSLQRILESISHPGRFSLIQLQPEIYELSKEGIFSVEEALQHPESEVRMLSLGLVGRLKQNEFIRFVGRLLEDPILDVRMKALNAMVEMGIEGKSSAKKNVQLSQELEGILARRLEESSWEEMARILQVIGVWRVKRFIPEVESQATHLHPWVRYRALETLLQLGPEGRRRLDVIVAEYRHIVFPILEDLDVRNDVQE